MDRKTKVLILVEGAKTDVRLMEHLLSVYGISQNKEIISYNTDIYDLYQRMFCDEDPDSFDLLQLLKEHECDPSKKKIFDEAYSDILLIFDFDPQSHMFSSEKIQRMANYFRESSDMGKLYLNYPMIEAFYHMKDIPDSDYLSTIATMSELQEGTYKSRVNFESKGGDYRKFAPTRQLCNEVILQNIEKAWYITGSTPEDSLFIPNTKDILTSQLHQLTSKQSVSVLCTCAFYIAEYNRNLLT